ncbi:MAG: GNAT family N-acetyltransferase [Actinomycetia bacterium]|nr:GNAT family N-acetyltransferase [Actinomycetes bacterium]
MLGERSHRLAVLVRQDAAGNQRGDLPGDWEGHYFDGSAPEKGRGFIIEVESKPVGMVAYADTSYDIDRRPVRAEIDILVGGPCQGRGYGVDAMRALLSRTCSTNSGSTG